MKQIILGTAGHIDHGKTSLIKAVTGVNTDRLKEEQERGITIELGFASMDLLGGRHLGIVDVPGHEKFVKNMVAGATGIDMVSMVIAADEGVMPQTREHMEICALLGIQHGLIALTKTDLVDEEWMELVTEDIREFSRGTFLEDCAIVPVSSASGDGIQEFVAALDELSAAVPERSVTNLFRLPVDRVFSMKGFGTVITGSLVSGKINVGDSITIYPSMTTSKVRGIQVHNESVETAGPGMRTAINFQGLEKASVNRGEVISTPGSLKPSYMVDVSLHFLNSNRKPAKNRTKVRFHTGTSEVFGYLVLLDRDELKPGEDIVAQLRLDTPVSLVRDDRFVIRSYSPVRTIGGGKVLNPVPQKHKQFQTDVVEGLKGLIKSEPQEIVSFHVQDAGVAGVTFSDLVIMTNLPEKQLTSITQALSSVREIIQIDKDTRRFVHKIIFDSLQDDTALNLENYHKANPLKAGMSKEELKSKFPVKAADKLFSAVMNQMLKAGKTVQEGEAVRMADHKVSLGIDQADIKKKVLDIYLKAKLQPPYFKEVTRTLEVDPARAKDVLMLLVKEGTMIKAKEDLFFHVEPYEDLRKRLVDFLVANEEITTPQFKEMTGASRKYIIPLLEYFDAKNVTIRVGDSRQLRKG
ncbi:MAG: selenocysteine-specific translation elongation factor [Deltaproteobacteria bacterium]|nr:selenocysteine-specific translation elongation factor [Deltaproteobacteria bacterium]